MDAHMRRWAEELKQPDLDAARRRELQEKLGARAERWEQGRQARLKEINAELRVLAREHREAVRQEHRRMTGRDLPIPPGLLRVSPTVAQQYPGLAKSLGKVLRVDDESHPIVQSHLQDLSRLPSRILRRARRAGLQEVQVGNASVPDLDNLQRVRGLQPQGWPPGTTWDMVAGAYSPTDRAAVAGVGRHGSVSVALHEFGHGLGHLLRYDDHPRLIAAHKAAYNQLAPYYRQDGPGGLAGRQEMLAEGFAMFYVKGEQEVSRVFGQAFVDFVKRVVIR